MATSKLSRRNFLRLSAAGTCGAAIHQLCTPAGGMFAYALPPVLGATGGVRNIVILNLAGGCSYNSAPIYLSQYRDLNPNISYGPENSNVLNAEQGLHPSFDFLKEIWDEGHLALLNLVGYPDPNRSHAESADIWFAGMRNASAAVTGGWGARMTQQIATTFGGISLSGQNLFVQGGDYPLRALGDLNNFGENSIDTGNGSRSAYLRMVRDDLIAKAGLPNNDAANFVRGQMLGLSESISRIKTELDPTAHPLPDDVTFGNSGIERQCRDAARLLQSGGLQTRVIFMEQGGFDTHSEEINSLPDLLRDIDNGLRSLVAVLKARGIWESTVICTMSEFCRTHQNDSDGTDHGHAGPMFVMGGSVVGGIKSPTPSASQMTGDYFHDYYIHFCEPFYQIVQWMGLNPDLVFPEGFNRRWFNLFA